MQQKKRWNVPVWCWVIDLVTYIFFLQAQSKLNNDLYDSISQNTPYNVIQFQFIRYSIQVCMTHIPKPLTQTQHNAFLKANIQSRPLPCRRHQTTAPQQVLFSVQASCSNSTALGSVQLTPASSFNQACTVAIALLWLSCGSATRRSLISWCSNLLVKSY